MMAFKLSTFIFAITALLGCLQLTNTASTTNGRLLKFYPISKEQYRAILSLARLQPAVSEDSIVESHRSLADWSSSIHKSWNNLFNGTKPAPSHVHKHYPMCVIKTPEVNRSKRYAGVAPTVVYPGTYPYPYPYPDEDHETEDHEMEDYDETEEEVATTPKPTEIDPSTPIINCVVVIRHKKHPKPVPEHPDDDMPTSDDHSHDHSHHHHYPHYPHYPYPLPPYGYPPHGHYPYPYPPHHHDHSSAGRSNSLAAAFDPLVNANYQQMIAEYYRHLQALYMADAYTEAARSSYAYEDYDKDDVEDDDDEEFEN